MEVVVDKSFASLFKVKNGIVKYPDTVLRQTALPVENISEVSKLIEKMSSVLRDTKGVGLAAPQIGVSKRVIMVRRDTRFVLINPTVQEASGEYCGEEGCLSIPGLWGDVKRYKNIVVTGVSPHGKETVLNLSDTEAVVVQHEIDHLDGVLFIDRAIPETLHWYVAASQTRIPAILSNGD